MKPRVTVVTPSLNQGKFLERTLLSVISQDYENLEYIVVDGGSTDNSEAVLRLYVHRIAKVIRAKDNGQSEALNKGFSIATGDILAYLNADDCYASPRVVRHAVQFLGENPEIDLVYGRRIDIDENGFFAQFNQHPFREFNLELLPRCGYIEQECAFWTKEIYDRAGGYVDPTYHFAMDHEMWLRFIKAGASFRSVDQVYGLFRWHSEQKSQQIYRTTGFDEIARLQREYIGGSVEPEEMADLYQTHFSGFNARENPDTAAVYSELREMELNLRRNVLSSAPLDHWVYRRDVRVSA